MKIADELGIEIISSDSLDAEGHYISAINTIIINDTLSDWKKRKTLLHELGHASKHKENSYLYNLTFSLHSKMEYEANAFMVNYIINESDGYYNFSQMIDEFGIGMGYDHKYKRFI